MSTIIIGIDPGLFGGVALLNGSTFEVWGMPLLEISRSGKKRRELDIHVLANKLDGIGSTTVEHVFLEQAWPRPTDSAVSGYKVGCCFGEIRGVLAALHLPFTIISPQRWKKELQVPADKDGARMRASQLIPLHAHNWKLKKHHGRAEAALIGLYGYRRQFRRLQGEVSFGTNREY